MVRGTAFEVKHSAVIQHVILGCAVLTYLVQPDDVVWLAIRSHANARLLEHLCFGLAAAVMLVATWWCTVASSEGRRPPASVFLLYWLGIASLLPPLGALLLLLLQAWHLSRVEHLSPINHRGPSQASWRTALLANAGRWSACGAMLLFSITLTDRLAEAMFATAAVVAVAAKISLCRMQTLHSI